jgi:hypothetical protein
VLNRYLSAINEIIAYQLNPFQLINPFASVVSDLIDCRSIVQIEPFFRSGLKSHKTPLRSIVSGPFPHIPFEESSWINNLTGALHADGAGMFVNGGFNCIGISSIDYIHFFAIFEVME